MTDTTPNLALPYLAAAQAQKHVTVNEALRALDALTHLAVVSRTQAAPPASPAEGDRYVVPAGATGAWAGRTGQIAAWQDGAWAFFAPRAGWTAFVIAEGKVAAFQAGAWAPLAADLQNVALFGLAATADAANPFTARLNKALWTARPTGEGGDGDLRYTLNKQAAGNVVSLLFQSNWSGRAELGLIGGDDLALRVSPDGTAWIDALGVDRASGAATFAGPIRLGGATAGFPALKRSGAAVHLRLADDSGFAALACGEISAAGVTVGRGGGGGAANTALGQGALSANTTGAQNTAIGRNALTACLGGGDNTAVGASALQALTTGSYNQAFGRSALQALTTGASNVAVGQWAAASLVAGDRNVAVGHEALFSLTSGADTVAVGRRAGFVATAANLTAVGSGALSACTTGAGNTALGQSAGSAVTTGADNIAIGRNAQVDSPTASGQINLGGRYFHDRLILAERADPAAPAADNLVLFARDSGAGKTQLCVRFPTGAVQVLASEP